ncbi:MAG: hypothetical protein HY670_06410 [Chloroflexi bacterium]|nr:hypothetical protein [Chloroflexota bacterium]
MARDVRAAACAIMKFKAALRKYTLMEGGDMIMDPGEKVHVIERRAFPEDVRRHFIGEVVRCTAEAIRLRGHAWVFDKVKGSFVRMPEKRERIVYPDNRLVINIIPREVNLDDVKYIQQPQRLVVTDGKKFSLEITEFSAAR